MSSSNNDQEKIKSRSDDNNSSSLSSTEAEAASLPLRKRKNMDRSGGAKRSPTKPMGGTLSALGASSKGRGRGGGKPSRGESNDNVDPIVDKKFFDGRYLPERCIIIHKLISPPSILTVYALFYYSLFPCDLKDLWMILTCRI